MDSVLRVRFFEGLISRRDAPTRYSTVMVIVATTASTVRATATSTAAVVVISSFNGL